MGYKFDFSGIDEQEDKYGLIPDCECTIVLEGHSLKEWDNGDVSLSFRCQILDGPHKGRGFFDSITVVGPENKRRFGVGRIRDLSRAAGLPDRASDADELLMKPIRVMVGRFNDKNQIKKVIFKNKPEPVASTTRATEEVPIPDDDVPF